MNDELRAKARDILKRFAEVTRSDESLTTEQATDAILALCQEAVTRELESRGIELTPGERSAMLTTEQLDRALEDKNVK